MTFPSVHGGGGHATSHYAGSADITGPLEVGESDNETASPRASYDWADDANKCYRLACDLIGVEVARKRLLKLLIEPLPEIEIAGRIE